MPRDVSRTRKPDTDLLVESLFAFKGIEAGAITSVISGIAPIVIAALSNLKKK